MRLPLLSPPRSQLPTASILRQGRLSITFPKRTAQPSPRCKQQQQQQRRALLSTTTMCAASESPESRFDPPTGNLFGVPPGEKYQKEGWENLWVYGFWGSLLLATVAYCFKPDTSIQTWALEEARRRLEREGILPDPDVAENPK